VRSLYRNQLLHTDPAVFAKVVKMVRVATANAAALRAFAWGSGWGMLPCNHDPNRHPSVL